MCVGGGKNKEQIEVSKFYEKYLSLMLCGCVAGWVGGLKIYHR